jgi:CO/xanthine dehydrogenase Mo-binding subunit
MILEHLTGGSAENSIGSMRRAGLSRRAFLKVSGSATGGLFMSITLPAQMSEAEAADEDRFAPNAFIRIAGDGQIVLTIPYVEMGQGTYTSIPMLIAEELEWICRRFSWNMRPPTKSSTAIPCWVGYRQRATRMRYAHRGSPCAKPVRSQELCSSRRRQKNGRSNLYPVAPSEAR